MKENHISASRKEICLLMNRYDKNRDGKVTFSEVPLVCDVSSF